MISGIVFMNISAAHKMMLRIQKMALTILNSMHDNGKFAALIQLLLIQKSLG
jgi:hypothetical protein